MGVLLYIDPGTGSMLFTILIGIIGAGIYSLRLLMLKIKFVMSGGKAVADKGDRIPYLIFSDHKRYWSVFEPVCREFDKRGIDVVYMTSSPDDPGLSSDIGHVKGEFIGEGNRAFARLNFIKADVLLSTTPGLDVYQWKRSRDVKYYVHIPHAASDITLYRFFGIDYYDSILLSGQYQADDVRALEKLRNLPEKELIFVGIPYMDVMLDRFKKADNTKTDQVSVLLAPTWGSEGILSKFGKRIIDELIKTGYHLIIRPHPQSFISEKDMLESLMTEYPDGEDLEWNRDNDNFEVLRKADVMISDFSGVIFDFTLVYDKPVIYTSAQIDRSIYDAWWLETPLWTEKILPKLGRELDENSINDVKTIIDECLNDKRFALGREEARKDTWAYMGEGAIRVVDYLVEKRNSLEKGEKG